MKTPVYIVDEIKAVVQKVNDAEPVTGLDVKYMFGHPKEIENRLKVLTQGGQLGVKFPLIALLTDVSIDRSPLGYYGRAFLTILVMNVTDPNYSSEQRSELNFKPILHPIKESFLDCLYRHPQFEFRTDFVDFTETEAYFYGSRINDKNIFGDFVDCIELSKVDVLIKNKICLTDVTAF